MTASPAAPLPLPPPRLRLLVDGRSAAAGHHLRVGRQLFSGIRGAVADLGRAPESRGAVHDFDCGSPELPIPRAATSPATDKA